jgi:teichuronic acid biosynthesis glycosyltransferase TuaG
MSQLPIISILTPTYNRGDTFLPETIQHIQIQQERGFTHEHIIVDNASTDNTEEVVRSFMKDDPRIKYIRNKENVYASGALNIAFKNSLGGFIVPFDDDDIMPELSLQMRFDAMKDPKIKWTSGLGKYVTQDNALVWPKPDLLGYYLHILPFIDENYELKDPRGLFLSFFRSWQICGGTVTIRRECVEEVGGWDSTFTASQDTEMWIKLASKHYHYKFINSYLFFYRLHEGQSSVKNAINGVWKELGEKLRIKYNITQETLDATNK